MTAGVLALVGILPQMPHFAFLSLAAGAYMMSTIARKRELSGTADTTATTSAVGSRKTASPSLDPAVQKAEIEALLPIDLISMDVGLDLLPLVDADRGGVLLSRIASLRKQLATELGLIVPPIHVRDDLRLRPGGYRLLISGVAVAEDEVFPSRVLAIDPTGNATRGIDGKEVIEPTFGLPAKWIAESEKQRAEAAGCTVVDASAVVATHLTEILRRHGHELLGRREAQELLDLTGKQNAAVIEELIPHHLSLGEVIKVLRTLLKEGVSLRDMRTVLETLADHAPHTKDCDELTELVRQRLARRISRAHTSADGELRAIVLDPNAEQMFREQSAANAASLSALTRELEGATRRSLERDEPAVLVVAPDVRRTIANVSSRHVPGLTVLSYREVDPSLPFVTKQVISVPAISA